MSKPTEAEIMVTLEQLDDAARGRVQGWMQSRWPRDWAWKVGPQEAIGDDELSAAERALDIAEAAANATPPKPGPADESEASELDDFLVSDVGKQLFPNGASEAERQMVLEQARTLRALAASPPGWPPPQRDLNKPPDDAPGWWRGPNGWERWVDVSVADCQHGRTASVQGIKLCLNCHGARVAEEVEEGDDSNQVVYAVRGIPVDGAMPFERLTTAEEYRNGVFEGPHDQTEAQREARVAAPTETVAAAADPIEQQSRLRRPEARLGLFGGQDGILSVAVEDLPEPVMTNDMATMRSQARLSRLLELMPSWKQLLIPEKLAPHLALCMLKEDMGLASQWAHAVDRKELLDLLETTPLAAVRAAELAQRDDGQRAEWRRIVEPRHVCDALEDLWRAAHYVVYVNDDVEIGTAVRKRLREEAERLLEQFGSSSWCGGALAAYAVAGRYLRWQLMDRLDPDWMARRVGSGVRLNRLLGTLIVARARARIVDCSVHASADWLDKLETARASADIAGAVQTILADGDQEAILAIQPEEVLAVLEEEMPVPPGAGYDYTSGSTSTVLLNRHCYPWWLGTVQAALRQAMPAQVNGAAAHAQ